ncbi:hypothetical protein JCM30471_13870 [Desulfuromonas carbonis]
MPRDIYENIRDFYVFEENGETVGTVCLHICWEDLAEVRSLAVSADCEGRGLGRELVEACLVEARDLGMKRVFALTYKPVFFAKLGFHEIEKSELPQKIWGDCMKCAKFPECDEEFAIAGPPCNPPKGVEKKLDTSSEEVAVLIATVPDSACVISRCCGGFRSCLPKSTPS